MHIRVSVLVTLLLGITALGGGVTLTGRTQPDVLTVNTTSSVVSASYLAAHPDHGTVKSHRKISDTAGGFTGDLDDVDYFGVSVANMGDLDGDGVTDLAVGANLDDDGGPNKGAVWMLFLSTDGTAKSHQKISDTAGGFTGDLDDGNKFGRSVANIGDLDGDGVTDLAVGAFDDDDGGGPFSNKGAVWILFLNTDGTVKSHQKISDIAGGFTGDLDDVDRFGVSVANIGDLDGDRVTDLAVGAFTDDDGGTDKRGAVWILFLNTDGTVKSHQKISDTAGGFTGALDDGDRFGFSAANMGDLDGDGITDLAVGAYGDDDGGTHRGAVWILFLNTDGTVKSHQKISNTAGGFTGDLDDTDKFGGSLANMGDLDGDGVADLAVGAYQDDDGGGPFSNKGAVWILFLNTDGTVKSHQKISDIAGGFTGDLDKSDKFGFSVSNLGDLDSDGVTDLAVGTYGDDDGGTDRGVVWILLLNPGCTLTLAPSYDSATQSITVDIIMGTLVAATMDLWMTSQGEIVPMALDKSVPVTNSYINAAPLFPDIRAQGAIAVFATLTTAEDNIICSDFETVDTGKE